MEASMPASARLIHRSLWWFKACWLLVGLTIISVLLPAPGIVILTLYGAAALAGVISAACLEQVKPTLLTDFVWSLTAVALFLFPIALVLHSVRVYRVHTTGAAGG